MQIRAAALVAAFAAAGCAVKYPLLTTPVVVKPEIAAGLGVLVRAKNDPSSKTSMFEVNQVMGAIAAAVREAGFRVTTGPAGAAPVIVTVANVPGERTTDGLIRVSVEVNAVAVDEFNGAPWTGHWQGVEIADFARFARQRIERSEALAGLAAELAAKPQVAKADQTRPWVKTTGASAVSRRLAVLEFRGALAPNLLAVLTDQARSAAVDAVRAHGIAVMTRENTAVMLKDQGKGGAACTEGDCEVETARLVGAHLVVTGEVSRIGNAQFLAMKLFDVESGALLASKQADAVDDLALVRAAKPAAAALFE